MKYKAIKSIQYRTPAKPGTTLREYLEHPVTRISPGEIFDDVDESIDAKSIAGLLRIGAIKVAEYGPL